MHPELFTFPGGFTIKSYGFCLMVGFLSAVWMAMRRAARVRVDPDLVLDVSFVALIAGVGFARLFYVVHYWQTQFADLPNRFLAIIDIRQGGLEFLGGLLGAMAAIVIYLAIRKQSIRLFLDILAPGAMWGLALGRVGCFFNGCCFGGVCTDANGGPKYSWAMPFPYGSPAHVHQWQERQVSLPAELLTALEGDLNPSPIMDTQLNMSPELRDAPLRLFEDAQKAHQRAMAVSEDAAMLKNLKSQADAAKAEATAHDRELRSLRAAQMYPSRVAPDRKITVSELQDLAKTHRSRPIHPTQLYAATSAMLLSGLLSGVFYQRKRHGVVIGLLCVLYPISRFLEELIRVDNPHDTGGFTVSQFISLSMAAFGIVYLLILYTRMPERSPYAEAAAPDPVENAE